MDLSSDAKSILLLDKLSLWHFLFSLISSRQVYGELEMFDQFLRDEVVLCQSLCFSFLRRRKQNITSVSKI